MSRSRRDVTTPPRLDPPPLYNSTYETRRRGTTTPVTPTDIGNAVYPPAFLDSLSPHVDEIREITLEKEAYTPICYVLNTISLQLATPNHAVVFTPKPDAPPTGDYLNYRLKPNLVARRTSKDELDKALEEQKNPTNPVVSAPRSDPTSLPIPSWSEIIAVIEVKCEDRSTNLAQMEDYLGALFLYRVDLPVVYGLLWRTADLRLSQESASVITHIRECKWEKSSWQSILCSYVTKIYEMENLRDKSLSYSPSNGAWTVNLRDAHYTMYPFHASSSSSRTTTVFLGWKKEDLDENPLILKHSLLPDDAPFFEGPLFQLACLGGNMPGLARLEEYERKPDPLDPGRVRTRLISSSVGKPLSQCPSVFELLQVFSDPVMAHEEMCKRDVLHCDISWGNIMCRTKDGRYREETRVSEDDIADTLNLANRIPVVLITDLDHGAQISEMAKKEPKGTRTGTPMFIALEVAGAPPITSAPKIIALFHYMESICDTVPAIHIDASFLGDFKQKARAYHDTYVAVADFESARTQKSKTTADLHKPHAVVHEPRHDVESMFWLLCFALARANPKSDAPNPHDPTADYSEFCDVMLNYPEAATLRDNRGRYLERTEEQWKMILHPKLAGLSSMLHHMGRYLAVRSFDKDTQWGLYHAHQVFKILLFSAIKTFQSGDPILLCPHAPRYSQPITGTRTGGNTSTIISLRETSPSGSSSHGSRKRGSNQAGLDAGDQKSAKRVKVDHPARSWEEEQPIVNAEVMEHLRMLRHHKSWYHTGSLDHCVGCRKLASCAQ